jgi:F0F1-type ATP synthase gamma subunit
MLTADIKLIRFEVLAALSEPNHLLLQASGVAEEVLKTEFDAARIIYNRFKSAIAYKPTIATVLSPDVSIIAQRQPCVSETRH